MRQSERRNVSAFGATTTTNCVASGARKKREKKGLDIAPLRVLFTRHQFSLKRKVSSSFFFRLLKALTEAVSVEADTKQSEENSLLLLYNHEKKISSPLKTHLLRESD